MREGLVRGRWLLAWVLVVAAGASVAWLAIGPAGREVTTLGQSRAAPVVVSPAVTVGPSTASNPPHPTPTDPGYSASPNAGVPPAATRAVAPSVPSRAATQAPSAASTPAAPASTSAALAVAGGTVWAVCTGGVARIDHVTPEAGWSSELDEGGDGAPEAKFRNAQTGAETEVHVACADGRPVISSS